MPIVSFEIMQTFYYLCLAVIVTPFFPYWPVFWVKHFILLVFSFFLVTELDDAEIVPSSFFLFFIFIVNYHHSMVSVMA